MTEQETLRYGTTVSNANARAKGEGTGPPQGGSRGAIGAAVSR